MGKFRGAATALLQPRTAQEVSGVLRHCHARRLAVVPQGGNTGLVGGSVPVFDEVILSLRRMNRIISLDEVSGILVCEAGCILEAVDDHLASRGFMMPVDLGAKGSCQIGGNVSTNAGGLRLLRYGSLHGSVLGLEVVLADGTVVDMLKKLRKDNTGYDLKQLFIGGEGTLGVITKVAMLVPQKPSSVQTAFLACSDYNGLQAAFKEARKQLGEILSAFELIDCQALDMALLHLEGTRHPLPDCREPFYVLLETSGSDTAHDSEKLERYLERVLEDGSVVNGMLAQDQSQTASLWRIQCRDYVEQGLAEAVKLGSGTVYKYDLSIPVKHLYGLVDELRARLEGVATVVGWGHFGDGNLHLNISAPKDNQKVQEQIEPFVYEWVASRGGSISAEHGLGVIKPHAIYYSKAPEAVSLMGEIKALLDQQGILNPYKVLPESAMPAH
eukprot:SM000318S12216  [mRNA]  locus=s318:87991:91818:+ [translate_table: standard]